MIQLIGLLVALVFLQVSPAYADDACEHWAAKITSMQGVVETRKHTTLEWVPAKLNESLCDSDAVRTAARSRARLQVQEETFITLHERSTVRFSSESQNGNGVFSHLLHLFSGEAYFRSRRPRELGIETPFVNAMHEGTEFLVKVNQDSTQIIVFDGVVVASNTLGQVSISEGQSALTMKGQAPAIGPRIELRDAVQWTLYYPPVIDYTSTSQNPSYLILKPALDRFQSNDLVGAFESLDSISEAERNADYHIVYASLLLTVGQVEQAQQLLSQLDDGSQQNANVLALQSIIALAKSDQQQALKLAEQAQQINPQAAAPKIALSYAYQSLFDIDKALKSATQAVKAAPDNGLAWARVSEMQLATGDVDASMEAAKKAQILNPKLSKTNTVLGFAKLASLDLSEAEQSFRTAIQRDPSDPLARLGLGLAKIRQGHIKSGTKEMETAANLDPDNALIRSYLGKAYYEQRRGDIASTEYAIAKKLDPNDPTPWFYDAIYKQTVNRPVEALHDMQKAIELNDNRAVFRSRLLLDKDLAARSAAQGRIYNELGFQQRGLLEGWKSVNRDPANYSAHRLLADNYAALPRHEVARVSELLQSQLLQTVNITPIQPNLAESNLFILNGLGPTDLSFNEFNPLFEYNRLALQASGFYGGNNTWGDNIAVSGLYDAVSFSLGQFHYETDGFRKNNSLNKDLYNIFIQSQVTEKFSLQAEYRHEERDNGDLSLNFDLNNFSNDFKEERNIDSYRVGGRYDFNSNSLLIGSLIYQKVDTSQKTFRKGIVVIPGVFTQPDEFRTVDTKRDGFVAEFQHIYLKNRYSFINGIGYIDQTTNETNTSDVLGTDEDPAVSFTRTNLYNYSKFIFPSNLSATLGLSIDFYEKGDVKLTPINPKLGLEWSPLASTTFRAAAFRTLAVTRNASQTIEPTQVAGFNQFFDDIIGTVAWRYGAGIDHKSSKHLSLGLEYSERKLYIPGLSSSVDRSEKTGRAYLYITPLNNISFSAEYLYEKIENPERGIQITNQITGGLFDTVETHRVPITLGFFHPTGLSFKIKNTFVYQKGLFQDLSKNSTIADKADFFVVDLELKYRFPRRYGMITFGINNLFNDKIHFQNTNNNEALLAPGRVIFSRITMAF